MRVLNNQGLLPSFITKLDLNHHKKLPVTRTPLPLSEMWCGWRWSGKDKAKTAKALPLQLSCNECAGDLASEIRRAMFHLHCALFCYLKFAFISVQSKTQTFQNSPGKEKEPEPPSLGRKY